MFSKAKLSQGVVGLAIAFSLNLQAVELPEPVSNADYYHDGQPPRDMVFLGQALFFDKILSGNKNISCATCHNPMLGGSDGLALGVGEGGEGLGAYRTLGEGEDRVDTRIGRHAPHIFNLGAKEFVNLNWNGIHRFNSETGEIELPSNVETPPGLNNVLAGQALFPIANLNEMVGDFGENDVADAVEPGAGRFTPIWDVLVDRLRAIPEYVEMFTRSFEDVSQAADIEIQHYANAVSAFQAFAFRSDNSPFDQYLRGNKDALTDKQIRGMELFYGDAGCSSCHSGVFQTDHQFYGIAMPQVGPGPEARFPLEDRGRAEATNDPADWAKFRTPSLRNVWITAPYGHTGAYNSLRDVVEHHLDPIKSLQNYRTGRLKVRKDTEFDATDYAGHLDLTLREKVIAANDLQPSSLTRKEMGDLLEFLRALTDWNTLDQTWMIPDSVPSGLPVHD